VRGYARGLGGVDCGIIGVGLTKRCRVAKKAFQTALASNSPLVLCFGGCTCTKTLRTLGDYGHRIRPNERHADDTRYTGDVDPNCASTTASPRPMPWRTTWRSSAVPCRNCALASRELVFARLLEFV
jgi:hypothetical protein